MSSIADDTSPGRIIAVLSGKGGSGKTMVSTVLGRTLTSAGRSALLVDADVGTAGLTYYMGVKHVRNTRLGLSSVIDGQSKPEVTGTPWRSLSETIQVLRDDTGRKAAPLRFFGIGDHRRLTHVSESDLSGVLQKLLGQFRHEAEWVIVDCRGGIDGDSLAVCRAADDLVLVTEPDITAYQATRHLVDVLSDEELAHKLRGFFLNKVFQDPSYIQARGTTEFGCQSLSAVPYDIETTRDFFVGNIPNERSPFHVHVAYGTSRLYPDENIRLAGRPWEFRHYDQASITDPDGARGGSTAAIGIAMLSSIYMVLYWVGALRGWFEVAVLAFVSLLGLIGSIPRTRRSFGRMWSLGPWALLRVTRRPR